MLRDGGARVTKPRTVVLKVLSQSRRPLSAREVFEAVSHTEDSIDQVTVYRVLETFLEIGMVHQVFPSGNYLPCFHSQCGQSMHVLVRCSSCESIEELDIPQETIAPMLWYLRREQGFEPDNHLFQVNGTCSSCQS